MKYTRIQKGQILFRQMNNNFFSKKRNLEEFETKNHRAHGIVIIELAALNNKLIAIPLRSSLKPYQKKQRHIISYKVYKKNDGKEYLKGLDLSKLLFIEENEIDFDSVFKTSDVNEQKFYRKRFNQIHRRAQNFIEKYISFCNDFNNLTDSQKQDFYVIYRFSTLRNYHDILGITVTKEDVKSLFNKLK